MFVLEMEYLVSFRKVMNKIQNDLSNLKVLKEIQEVYPLKTRIQKLKDFCFNVWIIDILFLSYFTKKKTDIQ